MAACWHSMIIYKSCSIPCHVFCCPCVYNPTKERISNKNMRTYEWTKRARSGFYLIQFSAITSEVTQLSTVKTFIFLLSTPFASAMFHRLVTLWGQVLALTTALSSILLLIPAFAFIGLMLSSICDKSCCLCSLWLSMVSLKLEMTGDTVECLDLLIMRKHKLNMSPSLLR